MLYVKDRELVVPGQLIAEGDYLVHEGAFHEGDHVYASVVGLVRVRDKKIQVIPLQGPYIPKRDDAVIGIVTDIHQAGWELDLGSPYSGNLFVSDLLRRKVDLDREDISRYLKIGDAVFTRVKEVDELMRVSLEAGDRKMGKIPGGKLVEISPKKIPRVIGHKGSMISVLQRAGGCGLKVGQNGRVVVWGKDPRRVNAVVEALLMIEREAHTSGLTDRVRQFLEEKSKGGA